VALQSATSSASGCLPEPKFDPAKRNRIARMLAVELITAFDLASILRIF